MKTRGPEAAFAQWASGYDEQDNPLIAVEQPVMSALMGDLTDAAVLDAGCGTGRLMRLAMNQGAAGVIGLDRSADMLYRAEGRRVRGDLTRLPFADATFGCVIAGLVIGYVERLEELVHETARVLRPGGRLICSDLHPCGRFLGWRRTYREADGALAEVADHGHGFSEIHAALRSTGFELIDVREPSAPDGAPSGPACPAALIWSARLKP